MSIKLRKLSIDLKNKRLLIARISGSSQEQDLRTPPNCNGFGRIKHFERRRDNGWPLDPLPIDPACKALGLPKMDLIRAQVFQIAACNWRCWYCFVPYNLLSANTKFADWLTPEELIDLYLKESDIPPVIDMSGGSPNLVPEWVPWMIKEVRRRKLENNIYLWCDDNLSNDYFWRFLSDADRELIVSFRNYGHVGCFKGFSPESFAFNTGSKQEFFDKQFQFMKDLMHLGIDIYAYTTFTTPSKSTIRGDMRHFIDMLQQLHTNLPLRTIPLQIAEFFPVKERITSIQKEALKNQWIAVEAWIAELECRFTSSERLENIANIKISCT